MKSVTIILVSVLIGVSYASRTSGDAHIRVRRGNYGERNSGGIGPSSALGVGYGGSTNLGHHGGGGGGGGVVFDTIAQKAVSGGNDAFIMSYQATQNAGASSAQYLDRLQQQGQHTTAAAGAAANAAGAWYNSVATGHVPSGYKGENRRK